MKFDDVHGDIRHLEITYTDVRVTLLVHGDIRHLEIECYPHHNDKRVHGDIRHLEKIIS